MAKRKTRKKKQQFDIGRGLLPVLLSVVTLTFTVFALVLESGLLWAVTGLSTVATAAAIKHAQKKDANDKRRKQEMPKTPLKAPTRLRPKPAQEPTEETVSAGGVKCTNTGRPIEGDGRCTCATRHVATPEGVKRFGGPIGRPIGKKAKEPRVPTTSRLRHAQGLACQRNTDSAGFDREEWTMGNREGNWAAANRARKAEEKYPANSQKAESHRADASRHDRRAMDGRHAKCGAPRCAGCS